MILRFTPDRPVEASSVAGAQFGIELTTTRDIGAAQDRRLGTNRLHVRDDFHDDEDEEEGAGQG